MKDKRKPYPSDLTDTQWQAIEPVVFKQKKRGRPPQDLREIINGVLYIRKSCLDWRMLPHDLPPWQTVYGQYKRWLDDGTWERINEHLRTWLMAGQQETPLSVLITWIDQRRKHVKEPPSEKANQMFQYQEETLLNLSSLKNQQSQ